MLAFGLQNPPVYVKVAAIDDCPARHAAPHDGMENEYSVTELPTYAWK